MNLIMLTDVCESLGFGRNMGAYKIASDLREDYNIQTIDFITHMTEEELNAILSKYIKSNTIVLISDTYLHSTEWLTKKIDNPIIIGGAKHRERDNFKRPMYWDKSDHIFEGEWLSIEASRGCPYKCSFCTYPTPGIERIKNINDIRNEMLRNYDLYGTTGYLFTDSTLNSTYRKFNALANMIVKLPFKIRYVCFSRLDKMKGLEQQYIESGCKSVSFGIESTNPIVQWNHKHSKIDVKKELHRLKEVIQGRFDLRGSFIAGLEGDSKEDLVKMGEWLLSKDNPLDSWTIGSLHYPDSTYEEWTVPIVNDILNHQKNYYCGFVYARLRSIGYTDSEVNQMRGYIKHLDATTNIHFTEDEKGSKILHTTKRVGVWDIYLNKHHINDNMAQRKERMKQDYLKKLNL